MSAVTKPLREEKQVTSDSTKDMAWYVVRSLICQSVWAWPNSDTAFVPLWLAS